MTSSVQAGNAQIALKAGRCDSALICRSQTIELVPFRCPQCNKLLAMCAVCGSMEIVCTRCRTLVRNTSLRLNDIGRGRS
jgi:hypothetical protein